MQEPSAIKVVRDEVQEQFGDTGIYGHRHKCVLGTAINVVRVSIPSLYCTQ
jgi:hypothetical protein